MLNTIFVKILGTFALLALGFLGGRIAKKIHCPSAPLLGAMFLIGFAGLAGLKVPSYKSELGNVAKILCGVILGEKINRNTCSAAKKMFCPLLLASVWMVVISVAAGWLLFSMSGGSLDIMTCLASSAAGGIAEMSIFAMSAGADVGVVAFFQAVRIILVVSSLPFIALWLRDHQEKEKKISKDEIRIYDHSLKELICFAAVVSLCALLGKKVDLPSPYMVGGMIGAAAMNIYTGNPVKLSGKMRAAAQLFIGISIGTNMTPRTIELMMLYALPLIVSVLFVQVFSFILAWLIQRMTGWDLMTTFLATAPGGSSQIIFIAEDVGADSLVAGVFHTVRMLAIVISIPLVARYMI